jgi:hypothetical protein
MARYDSFGPLDSPLSSEQDIAFSKFNTRLRPDQLTQTELAYSQNGRMDVDGAWQTRKGIEAFGSAIGTSSEALILPFYLYATVGISSAARVDDVVTVDCTGAHGFTTATQVGIAGLTGSVDPNGNQTITVVDSDTFTFTISGATGSETYTGTGTAGAGFLSDAVNGCWGSCLFSDPSNSNAEYIILATYSTAIAVNRASGATTNIAYPTGITITGSVEMKQAFDKVYIFRDGETALEWDGVLTGSPAFAKVANGTYIYPTYYNSSTNTDVSDGIVTVTETGHGLSVGDKIVVIDNDGTALEEGAAFTVASVPTSDTFIFYAQVVDYNNGSVVYAKKGSEGRGFSHMPAPAWGVYHQRRLIVPFAYTTTGSSGSETVATRNIKDEILFSDILDGDTYDILQNNFRITAGISDYVQTIHPFTDDAAVAFNRNSIHLMTGLSGELTDVTIKEITREAGCLARKSVVTIGSEIFFLSDNGVYATEFGDLYNLRGAGLPLSAPINSVIQRINTTYAYKAVGVYHDNRYWLAVPLDNSTANNAILVYNLLNKGWESVDIVEQDGWDIANLIVSGNGGVNKLFAVNSFGGIHILDERVDDVDRLFLYPGVSAASYPISSYATTRQYSFGTAERKKFNTFEIHVESSTTNASDATIDVETENVDSTQTLGSLSSYLGTTLDAAEDSSIRGRIGNIRGYGLQMTLTPTQGRPKLRMVKINAIPAFQSVTQAS